MSTMKKGYDVMLRVFDTNNTEISRQVLAPGCERTKAKSLVHSFVKKLDAGEYNDFIRQGDQVSIDIKGTHFVFPGSGHYKVSRILEPETMHIYDITVTQVTTINGVEAPNRDIAMQKAQEKAWCHGADRVDAMVISEDGDTSKGDIADHIMLSLKEVLALIPNDDIAGPKPSKLRADILALAGMSS